MMRWEWSEPVNCKVMGPDDKDRQVYRQDPKHKNKNGMGVVIKIIVGVRSLDIVSVAFERETGKCVYLLSLVRAMKPLNR